MRKVEIPISTFVLGNFRKTLQARLENQKKQEENRIAEAEQQIAKIEGSFTYKKMDREKMIEDFQKSIRKINDRLSGFKNRIKGLKDIDPSDFEKRLKKNESFASYTVDDRGWLNLYTKTLVDKAERKNIGRFRIGIPSNQGSTSINNCFRVVNLDYNYHELDHWAIKSRVCCLGEWELDVKKILGEADIPSFFDLAT